MRRAVYHHSCIQENELLAYVGKANSSSTQQQSQRSKSGSTLAHSILLYAAKTANPTTPVQHANRGWAHNLWNGRSAERPKQSRYHTVSFFITFQLFWVSYTSNVLTEHASHSRTAYKRLYTWHVAVLSNIESRLLGRHRVSIAQCACVHCVQHHDF